MMYLSLFGRNRRTQMTQPKPEIPDSFEWWTVLRIDDNGNTFVVRDHLARTEADRMVAEFTARGHKQTYWAEPETRVAARGDAPDRVGM
jgi:hypothetical protein